MAVLVLAATGAPALAQPSASSGAVFATPDFIAIASQADEYERQAGRLASRKAMSAQVRAFGARMAHDHARTTSDLQAAIRKSGMAPAPASLRPDQQQMLAQLRSASGAGFDRTYIAQQVQVHRQVLAVMSAYARGGGDPNIKAVAARATPIVEHHLRMAQRLQGAH
jgi:putative membrane protein